MSRFLYSLLIAALMTLQAQAQQVLYSAYEPYDLNNGNMAVVGKVNGSLFTFRSYGKEYFLDAYDDKMERTATIVLDFFPEKIYKVRFVPFEKSMLVLYQEEQGTRITQYAALLDDKGFLQGRALKIDEERGSFFGSGDKEFYASAVSENREHIVVYKHKLRNKNMDFEAYWLDAAQMKITKRVKLKYKAGNTLATKEAMLSNTGDFFLPVFTNMGSRNYADEYTLLTIKKEERLFRNTDLGLATNYLEYPFQKLDNTNGKIHFAAFFSTKKNGNNEGVAAASFDLEKLTFEKTSFIPFDDELRAETGARRKDRALNEFRIGQMVVKNDGGFVIAAEENYVSNQSNYMPGIGFYSYYYSPMMTQIIREYHYNDILVLSYNANNEKEWHNFVRKEQYSQEDGGIFSSYTMLNTGGGLGFLFNDFKTARSRIQLATITPEGKSNIGFMDAGNSADPDWLPRLGKQVDNREIVVPCLRKKQICFAKIVL